MHRRLAIGCLLILSVVFFESAYSADYPSHEIPRGYTWKILDEIDGGVLIPDGWYYLRELRPGVVAYFVSKQDISNGGMFTTGLTIEAALGFSQKSKGTAEGFAMNTINRCGSGGGMKRVWNFLSGPLMGYGCRYQFRPTEDLFLQSDHIAMGSSRTGTLYFAVFESPQSESDDVSAIREQLLNSLVLEGQGACVYGNENKLTGTCAVSRHEDYEIAPARLYGSLPLNEVSEYFETKSTGLIFDAKELTGQFSLVLKERKELPKTITIVVQFENPADEGKPIEIVRRWKDGKDEMEFLSPKQGGFKCGYYWANVSIYRRPTKKRIIGTHRQLIQSRVDLSKVHSPGDLAKPLCN